MDKKYCYGCMREYPQGETVCPSCGYRHGKDANPVHALQPGATLSNGRYLVGKLLGQGGFGITYVGLDNVLQLKVAIKEYYPMGQVSRSMDSSALQWQSVSDGGNAGRESFLKEARKMAKVASIPNTVQVNNIFYQNNTAYIVMSFIEGETLKARLMRIGAMTPDGCITLLMPVMEALEQAHESGLIHRDISPDNIMIDPKGKVWILDLGAAKDLDAAGQNQSQASQNVIKRGFSPPEQIIGSNVGSWTDVYAMCAIIYYCLTGKLVPDATSRLINDTLSFPPEIPAGFAKVLSHGLALREEDRIRNMRELEKELNHAIKGEGEAQVKPEENGKEQRKPTEDGKEKERRRGKQSIAIIVGVLALACAIILCATQHWGSFHEKVTPTPVATESPVPSATPTPSPTSAPTPTPSPAVETSVTVVNYDNGNVYEGEIRDGKRNGYGTMTYANGDVFEGEWKDDLLDGQGTYTWANGEYYTGEYANSKRNGQGTYCYANGNIYEGEWVDGLKSGQGTFTWADSTDEVPHYYTGEWANDKINGQGWEIYSNGNIYEGEFVDGVRSGQGTMTYLSGDVYRGEWKDDLFNGQGTYTWADSTEDAPHYYTGEFVNDKRNGQGTYMWANGDVYEGELKDGRINGQGTYTWADSTEDAPHYYTGEWKEGKRNGYGTLYYTDGRIYTGEWKDGNCNGQGKITYSDGTVQEGIWEDGEFKGSTAGETENVKAGDVVSFGSYEQDNDITNGMETIEWLVLEVNEQANKALLLSVYGLDCQQYHTQETELAWENCWLRSWLNNDFFEEAFKAKEKEAVLLTQIDNSREQSQAPVGDILADQISSSDTEDKVFLLSIAEAFQYLPYDYDRLCQPTSYTQGKLSVYNERIKAGWWWLRGISYEAKHAFFIDLKGLPTGQSMTNESIVRPAIWIDLSYVSEEDISQANPIKTFQVSDFSKGGLYTGEVADGMRSGFGTMEFFDKRVYVGEWADDMINGQGTMTYGNGDVYEGEWVAGLKSGQGKMTYSDGTVQEGLWEDDEFKGSQEETTDGGDTIYCPECGNKNAANNKFCMYCGHRLAS